jgi:hypothetical protein
MDAISEEEQIMTTQEAWQLYGKYAEAFLLVLVESVADSRTPARPCPKLRFQQTPKIGLPSQSTRCLGFWADYGESYSL